MNAVEKELREAGRFLLEIADALIVDRGAPADAAKERMRVALGPAQGIETAEPLGFPAGPLTHAPRQDVEQPPAPGTETDV